MVASLRFECGATLEVTSGSSELSCLDVSYPYEIDEMLGQGVALVEAGRKTVTVKLDDGSQLDFAIRGAEEASLDAYLYA